MLYRSDHLYGRSRHSYGPGGTRNRALLWYILFGALHEGAHILAARCVGLLPGKALLDRGGTGVLAGNDVAMTVLRAALGRYCMIPAPGDDAEEEQWRMDVVRHAGWMFSASFAALLITAVLAMGRWRRPNKAASRGKHTGSGEGESSGSVEAGGIVVPSAVLGSPCVRAALITALESICTDLLGLGGIAPAAPVAGGAAAVAFLYCGNFGLLLLDRNWTTSDSGRAALDVLEKMVSVTMMRGAQSGGVVTFGRPRRANAGNVVVGVRSRCVNAKRTDLSKKIRAKVNRDVFSPLISPAMPSSDLVQTFVGHTRFATTSKATFEGTHPQQWTPPMYRRLYNFNLVGRFHTKSSGASKEDFPRAVRVENYVTHNGDFDFYEHRGRDIELSVVQSWLVRAAGAPAPAPVDSAAIAGMIDILRTQGCFGLSVRYAICLALPASRICEDPDFLPTYQECEKVGRAFEKALDEMLSERDGGGGGTIGLEEVGEDPRRREELACRAARTLRREGSSAEWMTTFVQPAFKSQSGGWSDEEEGGAGDGTGGTDEESGGGSDGGEVDSEGRVSLHHFATIVVDAFFDNDLFHSTKTFLSNAKGSFGLAVTASLDAQRQICLAARGQTLSVAFYPTKGIVLYGSEQAAVKAAMNVDVPGDGRHNDILEKSHLDVDHDALRLDLDDLGGEICLLDWGGRKFRNPALSVPDRATAQKHRVMNGSMNVYLFQESSTAIHPGRLLYHRMTRLTRNQFVRPLQPEAADLILKDIRDIPRVCQAIQDDWRGAGSRNYAPHGVRPPTQQGSSKAPNMSLNRLTAWNLARCLRKRMEGLAEGTIHRDGGTVDILLTGCEVSLWLAEQFASDLQKALPKLRILAVSSNKLLGLFGQELSIPTTGYPMSEKTHRLNDSIVIIVSHSGGTFAPLACSNLLQSTTTNLFVVTSEWDTQVGKQLRQMHHDDDRIELLFNSRIFTTDVGMRPAEPCSVSVAATHQLLTNLFQHICIVILSHQRFRHVSGAVITERDLRVLERCNQDNILALEEIVGVDVRGNPMPKEYGGTERELRRQGDVWSEHILENAKAYIMSFVYIMATVISGYPLAYLIASSAGLASAQALYVIRAIDSLIYFYLPQINILLLRLFQRRSLRHRMVGRTVVVGDIPWVSQAAEAFLSKIFACSYSIAGLNVLSGNPADHFVHRHTHRVVRGSLVVCGRPDGRLSALSSLESAVCLSVNQASSIQSMGATCESITIGHNPFRLPLTANGIFLKRHRPLFLCEQMLDDADLREDTNASTASAVTSASGTQQEGSGSSRQIGRRGGSLRKMSKQVSFHLSPSPNSTDRRGGRTGVGRKRRSSTALMGAYMNLEKEVRSSKKLSPDGDALDRSGRMLQECIQRAIHERKWLDHVRKLFEMMDTDGDGTLSLEEFVTEYSKFKPELTRGQLIRVFREADVDDSGNLSLDEFFDIVRLPQMEINAMLQHSIRDSRGLIQVEASDEDYFGENEIKASQLGKSISQGATRSQHFSQELYETRVASLQRFVAMTTMFHQMGHRVQSFFPKISFDVWGYRMDRTHSIMRIATTASPVSGADVRERMRALKQLEKVLHSIHVISVAWLSYRQRKEAARVNELEQALSTSRAIQAKERLEKREKESIGVTSRLLSCPENLHHLA
mmetsp:Transcript_55168/g.165297  ORF Transcript_55168/g.165297 Transcript_55168/m.165297 type:complete len:1653 (-) Transcript_55168:851-5809(-)